MKLISWNVNGIKSTYENGGLGEVFDLNPDILCLQEVKNKPKNLDMEIVYHKNYNGFFYPSSKFNRYSGVATYTKYEPISLKQGFDSVKFDCHGRIQRMEFDEFNLFNIYFPSGASDADALNDKYEFYDLFTKYVNKSKKPQVICGDFNRMSKEIDGSNPEKLCKKSGFLPEEQKWFSDFLESGFIDSFRLFNNDDGKYSWWANGYNCREKNIGMRLDYFLVSQDLKDNVVGADILSDITGSDHAPISLELEF